MKVTYDESVKAIDHFMFKKNSFTGYPWNF